MKTAAARARWNWSIIVFDVVTGSVLNAFGRRAVMAGVIELDVALGQELRSKKASEDMIAITHAVY